jgi:hypothetical protein
MIKYCYSNNPTSQYQLSVLALHYCDKILVKTILKKEKIYFGSWFHMFLSMVNVILPLLISDHSIFTGLW